VEEGLFVKGRKKRGAILAASAGIASERDRDGLVVEGEVFGRGYGHGY
jgi:hypothetical protein